MCDGRLSILTLWSCSAHALKLSARSLLMLMVYRLHTSYRRFSALPLSVALKPHSLSDFEKQIPMRPACAVTFFAWVGVEVPAALACSVVLVNWGRGWVDTCILC